ncbi:hypothetical protein J6590_029817, partial [Homalodisca vitripennis]
NLRRPGDTTLAGMDAVKRSWVGGEKLRSRDRFLSVHFLPRSSSRNDAGRWDAPC